MIQSKLIDARNWAALKPALIAEVATTGIIGLDIETQDENRHEGLNKFMSGLGSKLVFDTNKTTVTGFSWYCDKSDTAYYLNLAHADVENRIPWSEARQVLDAKAEDATWIIHNAPFEKTMMRKSLGFRPDNAICTLQMAVSCFNDDQYPQDKMLGAGFGGMASLMLPIARNFGRMNKELNEEQDALLQQVIGKSSIAQHSYNGYCRELSYGYGLKKLTKSLFGYEQTSFKTVLNGRAHMGELTGDEVCAYGADDAYWCVRIFHELLPRLMAQNDKLLDTFLEQENPMTEVFSEIWGTGLRINVEAVQEAQMRERAEYAAALREMQAEVRRLLPFPAEPNEGLMQLDSWYQKNPTGYRDKITKWALKDLSEDDFAAVHTTTGPVSDAWSTELRRPRSIGPNLSYYMSARTLMYDLTGLAPIVAQGKTTSDAGSRLKLKGQGFDTLLDLISKLAGIETRMKLYITPYLQLIDPETGRVYPVVNSMLNSRRMAMKDPNGMQLSKRGEGAYIRGFYLADDDDSLIVSIDWSQVELVLIGDFSEDAGFREAYGQLPFKDLHKKAVSDMLNIAVAEVTKDQRNKIGKVSNFGYWYSGALNTTGQSMDWSSEKMWEMTEKYRTAFPEAEAWRVALINEARTRGFVTLPDGHRRVRWEATYVWQKMWRERWDATGNVGLSNFGVHFIKKITNRAGNQIVNSMIQGTCATLAKRSILAINKKIKEQGLRARFMLPIHDELVFSVHRDDVVAFIPMAKTMMSDHPDIVKHLKMDATVSVGQNFEPYHPDTAPYGQIELDEAPHIPGVIDEKFKGEKLPVGEWSKVLEYLRGGTNALV